MEKVQLPPQFFWASHRDQSLALLFLIYVNYLPNGIKSKVRLFADDTIMYLTINNSDNCQQLQMT